MFLTLKNEKTLKKMRSKTLKNNIFFILGRNLIIRSFEIPHSIWKLHKDFKSVFVFKFRQKTKKFTPKWQKPLFEKRVHIDADFIEAATKEMQEAMNMSPAEFEAAAAQLLQAESEGTFR